MSSSGLPENSGLKYDQLNCGICPGGACGCIGLGGFAGGLGGCIGACSGGFGGCSGFCGEFGGWLRRFCKCAGRFGGGGRLGMCGGGFVSWGGS